MPMSGICIANDETKAEPEKLPILIKSLPGTHAARESSVLYAKQPGNYEIVSKSGNKLPTIVQKVYLRIGKIVHEIVKNFFLAPIAHNEY